MLEINIPVGHHCNCINPEEECPFGPKQNLEEYDHKIMLDKKGEE